jgi:uncharacterized membrane protein
MDDGRPGGPVPIWDQVAAWLAPRGTTIGDGARLAAINAVGLVVSLIIVTIVSLLTRALDNLLPIAFVITGPLTIAALIAGGLVVWYRYAVAHGRESRALGRAVRADVFAAVAAVPFAILAVILTAGGIFGLFVSVLTISGSRAVDALRQLLFAVLFLGLVVALIGVTRAAND